MGLKRKALVFAVLVVIVGGHLVDLIQGSEHWPFSSYPMYSRVLDGKSLYSIRMFGVASENGNDHEFLLEKASYFYPLTSKKINKSLERMIKQGDRARLNQMMSECLSRYEAGRISGNHSGPALQSLRLYNLRWTVDPWARNCDLPTQRNLLHEVHMP